jgi:hypothetical protein
MGDASWSANGLALMVRIRQLKNNELPIIGIDRGKKTRG